MGDKELEGLLPLSAIPDARGDAHAAAPADPATIAEGFTHSPDQSNLLATIELINAELNGGKS